jgi:hypothetical protein
MGTARQTGTVPPFDNDDDDDDDDDESKFGTR